MREIQLALIGCGGLGGVHARCIAQIDGARIIAWCDIVEQAALDKLGEFGGEYATTDAERVFRDPRISAVYICTQHDSHAALAIRAARAGKHVLIEKPLALTVEECEQVLAEVEKAGVILMPAFNMRFFPMLARVRQFIPKPLVIVGQMMCERWPDGKWAQDPVKGGANVLSQGCHMVDLLRYLSGGEPRELWATGGAMTHPGHPCIDQCVASIRFESGCVGSWIQGDAGLGHFTGKLFIELFGGNGRTVQLAERCKKAVFTEAGRTWTETCDDDPSFMLENREFLAALTESRTPMLTAEDGIQATRIILAADRAIRTGEVQQITGASAPAPV